MEPAAFEPFPRTHRGVLTLWLGIGAVACQVLACGCCPIFLLASVPLGACAWIFAQQDLRGIEAGTVDPAGRQNLTAGRALGMVTLGLAVLNVLSTVGMAAFMLLSDEGDF